MGKLLKILTIIFVLLMILAIGKNIFIKAAVEKGVQVALGLPLKIEKFDMGIVSTHIGIKNLNLYNPNGFPNEVMFSAPEIFVDYKLGAILSKTVHLEDIRLDFDQFVIVKNREGKVNLDVLKSKLDKGGQGKTDAKSGQAKKEEKKQDFNIQIDHLKVNVGKVVYKDYSKGGEPSVKEFKVNLSEEFNDISNSNMAWLVLFITQKALLKTTLSSVVDLNLDVISDAVAIPKEVVGQTVGTLKDAAGSIKDKIKLPFGDK